MVVVERRSCCCCCLAGRTPVGLLMQAQMCPPSPTPPKGSQGLKVAFHSCPEAAEPWRAWCPCVQLNVWPFGQRCDDINGLSTLRRRTL
eukprot:1158302-Pelagomonas_calceolata.AAC.5